MTASFIRLKFCLFLVVFYVNPAVRITNENWTFWWHSFYCRPLCCLVPMIDFSITHDDYQFQVNAWKEKNYLRNKSCQHSCWSRKSSAELCFLASWIWILGYSSYVIGSKFCMIQIEQLACYQELLDHFWSIMQRGRTFQGSVQNFSD